MINPFVCCFLAVWGTGWFFGCCAVLWFGVSTIFTRHEDTRGGRIEEYCKSVAAWEAGGYEELEAFQFTLNSSDNKGISCSISRSGAAPQDLEARKMSDGECDNYKLGYLECKNLEKLVPAPEPQKTYDVDLFAEPRRSLLTKRESQPIGLIGFSVAVLRSRTVTGTGGKNCYGQCRNNQARRQCENAGGQVRGGRDTASIECDLLHRLKDPCFVLRKIKNTDGTVGSWSFAIGLWDKADDDDVSLPTARCKKSPGWLGRNGHETIKPQDSFVTPEALRELVADRSIVLRSSTDPYVIASKLSDSSFDFGFTKGAMIAGGIGLCCLGCCMCCCGCGALAAIGGGSMKRGVTLSRGEHEDAAEEGLENSEEEE